MSMPDREIQLPDHRFDGQRSVRMHLSIHGDIMIDTTYEDVTARRFGFAHGSETIIVAAGLGYFARLGYAKAKIQKVFTTALAGPISEFQPDRHTRHPNHTVLYVALNKPRGDRFDLPDNLHCLVPQIPIHPGTTEHNYSTGFYTYTPENENEPLKLAMVGLPPYEDFSQVSASEINRFDFYPADIPPFIKLIGDCALGQYREDIAALVHAYAAEPEN